MINGLSSLHLTKWRKTLNTERACIRQGQSIFEGLCWPFVGARTKHGPPSVDRVRGLRPWTFLFLLALKLVVIKDYECVLRLSRNLNSCLLLKSCNIFASSLKFIDKKFLALRIRNMNSIEESLQTGSPNWFYSYAYILAAFIYLFFFIILLFIVLNGPNNFKLY